jgi:hypothetical protein
LCCNYALLNYTPTQLAITGATICNCSVLRPGGGGSFFTESNTGSGNVNGVFSPSGFTFQGGQRAVYFLPGVNVTHVRGTITNTYTFVWVAVVSTSSLQIQVGCNVYIAGSPPPGSGGFLGFAGGAMSFGNTFCPPNGDPEGLVIQGIQVSASPFPCLNPDSCGLAGAIPGWTATLSGWQQL